MWSERRRRECWSSCQLNVRRTSHVQYSRRVTVRLSHCTTRVGLGRPPGQNGLSVCLTGPAKHATCTKHAWFRSHITRQSVCPEDTALGLSTPNTQHTTRTKVSWPISAFRITPFLRYISGPAAESPRHLEQVMPPRWVGYRSSCGGTGGVRSSHEPRPTSARGLPCAWLTLDIEGRSAFAVWQ
jgi:hypothetical protein